VVHGVQINGWNFVDQSTTSSSATGASQTSASTASSSTSGSAAANITGGSSLNVTSNGSTGLSSGAKAGIGIAVALGVIGVCCLVATYTFFRRRRHAREKGQENFVTPPDYYAEAPATQYADTPKADTYYAGQQQMQQPYVAPVEIGQSKPSPPVEIG